MTDRPLVVTLESQISIPGPNHYPSQTIAFRAREHQPGHNQGGMATFFGVNVGPDGTVVDVREDNIRGIAYVGDVIDNQTGDDE